MLGLGVISLSISGGTAASILSPAKAAKAAIDLLISRASATATVEGYDCMVDAVTELLQ